MESVNLTRDEFNKNSIIFDNGFESKVFIYSSNEKEVVIKMYYDLDQINIDKIKKVGEIKSDILVVPKKLVSIDNEIIGYSMNYKKNYYPIRIMKKILSEEEKIDILMKLRKEIINLRNQNCIYGDLNLNNIITNGSEVCLCDSVNIKIGEYNFDEINSTMYKYRELKDTLEGIDCYMLNLLTIYLLNDIEYEEIIDFIENILTMEFNKKECPIYAGINSNQECKNICYEMISEDISKNFLIDYINKEKEKQFNC